MKKALLAAGMLAVMVGFQAPSYAADDADFVVHNKTGETLTHLQVAMPGTEEWADLDNCETIANGANVAVTLRGKWAQECTMQWALVDAVGKAWKGEMTLCDKDNVGKRKDLTLTLDGNDLVAE